MLTVHPQGTDRPSVVRASDQGRRQLDQGQDRGDRNEKLGSVANRYSSL